MKKKADTIEKMNIEMTSIQLDEVSRNLNTQMNEGKKTKRNFFPTLVLGLLVITLITTALSVAKYATTQTSGQLASVRSNDFIWNCNLVSGGNPAGEKVIGDTINKQSNVLSDSYIDFSVVNFSTVNMVTKVNQDGIDYRITLSSGSGLKLVDLDDSMTDAIDKAYHLNGNDKLSNHFRIEPNGTEPGLYSGIVQIASTTPYVKVYEQEINIRLNDIAYPSKMSGGEKVYTIQNGVKEHTLQFTYDKEVFYKNVYTSPGVEITYSFDDDHNYLSVKLPIGCAATIAFARSGTPTNEDDVTESVY